MKNLKHQNVYQRLKGEQSNNKPNYQPVTNIPDQKQIVIIL